jgi:hypothetical protein
MADFDRLYSIYLTKICTDSTLRPRGRFSDTAITGKQENLKAEAEQDYGGPLLLPRLSSVSHSRWPLYTYHRHALRFSLHDCRRYLIADSAIIGHAFGG